MLNYKTDTSLNHFNWEHFHDLSIKLSVPANCNKLAGAEKEAEGFKKMINTTLLSCHNCNEPEISDSVEKSLCSSSSSLVYYRH